MKKAEIKYVKKYLRYFIPSFRIACTICICFVIIAAVSFFRPLIIKSITDKGMMQSNFSLVVFFSLLLLMLSVIDQVISALQSGLFVDLQNKVQLNLYEEAFKKILHIRITYFIKNNSAETISRIKIDIEKISTLADRGILFLFNYILCILSGVIGLILINWKLAVIVMVVVPVKFLVIRYLAKARKFTMQNLINSENEMVAWLDDQVNGIKEIRLWNLYKLREKVFKEKELTVLRSLKKNSMLDVYNLACECILEWGLTSILYIIGGLYVCRGQLTIGSVIAFLTYSAYVTGPISSIFNIQFIFANVIPSAKRLYEFMNIEEEIGLHLEETPLVDFRTICFHNVKFKYDGELIIQNVDVEIKNGEKIAIIGPNGSGKTTILNLLLRFLEPLSGYIEIDGVNIKNINIISYRELYSLVAQEIYLFQDSLINNIDINKKATKENLNDVCKVSNLKNLINKLPAGFESNVDSNGRNFSGGERQRIALARAILKNSPIIIFDEAASNLDKESTETLYNLLFEEFKGKTVIIVTHSYDKIDQMNKVYEVKEHTIKEVFRK